MAAMGSWCWESKDNLSSESASRSACPKPRAPRNRLCRAASAAPQGGDAEGGAGGAYFAAGFLLKKSGMLNFSGTPIFLLMNDC